MFCQTIIRSLIKNNLKGGATNDSLNKNLVHLTIIGSTNQREIF